MPLDQEEVIKGVKRTLPYILSHHTPKGWYRCYSLEILTYNVHICSRCIGIYLGIFAGVSTFFLTTISIHQPIIIALLPLPAFLDWVITTFTDRTGFNIVRSGTGFLLGFGYGSGLCILAFEWNFLILLIGIAYVVISAIFLFIEYQGIAHH